MPRKYGHTKTTKPWERRRWLTRDRRKQLGKKRESGRNK